MADEKIERVYTIPLNKAYDYIRTKRARRAVNLLRKFLERHGKVDGKNVSISNALNKIIWQKGIQKPPRKVKIRMIKENAKVKAYLHDEKPPEEVKQEKKPENKDKKEKIEQKNEKIGETKK